MTQLGFSSHITQSISGGVCTSLARSSCRTVSCDGSLRNGCVFSVRSVLIENSRWRASQSERTLVQTIAALCKKKRGYCVSPAHKIMGLIHFSCLFLPASFSGNVCFYSPAFVVTMTKSTTALKGIRTWNIPSVCVFSTWPLNEVSVSGCVSPARASLPRFSP